jgi:hypothetical protein
LQKKYLHPNAVLLKNLTRNDQKIQSVGGVQMARFDSILEIGVMA